VFWKFSLRALSVTHDDFADALKKIGPSASRELNVELPDVSSKMKYSR